MHRGNACMLWSAPVQRGTEPHLCHGNRAEAWASPAAASSTVTSCSSRAPTGRRHVLHQRCSLR
jgi:hypothetical protein